MGEPITMSLSFAIGQRFRFTVAYPSGEALGWSVRFRMRHPTTGAVLLEKVIGDGITVGADGWTVELASAETRALALVRYDWSLWNISPPFPVVIGTAAGFVTAEVG